MSKVYNLFLKNKRALMLAAGIGLVLLFMPFYFAEAFSIYDWCDCHFPESLNPVCWFKCLAQTIASLPIRIVFFVIVGILGLLSLLAGLIYAITVFLVNWLIVIIMSVGIVPGAATTPQIVEIGWEFSRQFANLFFILALAFIGLATVLRIKEYEMKKALPTLIIIALLINFTPVIVGFVVDMGNIVTKFFLENAGDVEIFGDVWDSAWGFLSGSAEIIFSIDGEFFEKLPYIMAVLLALCVYGTVLLLFFFLGTFVYILVGAVFFFRTIILWILMILSPIAFLSKVFPDTRTTKMIFPDILHWDKWWEKLIQWTVVGIPISFFLYLSNLIITYEDRVQEIFDVETLKAGITLTDKFPAIADPDLAAQLTEAEIQIIELFGMILAPTVALVLLAMGALISFKAAPEGAKGIIRFTHERGVQRAWGRIKRIPGGIRNIRDSYRVARRLDSNLTWRSAVGRVIKQETWEKRPWKEGWKKGWPGQRGEEPSSATTTTTTTAEEASTEAPWGIDQGAGPEESLRQEPSPSAPTPSVSKRTKAKRYARGFFITEPVKIGLWAGKGIVKAAESAATKKIDKELKTKKEGEQKTCSNPTCGESIKASDKFCPECGQAQS